MRPGGEQVGRISEWCGRASLARDEDVLRPASGSNGAVVRCRWWLESLGDGIVDRRRAKLGDRHARRADLALRDTDMVLERMQGRTRLPGDEQCRQKQENSHATRSSHDLFYQSRPILVYATVDGGSE